MQKKMAQKMGSLGPSRTRGHSFLFSILSTLLFSSPVSSSFPCLRLETELSDYRLLMEGQYSRSSLLSYILWLSKPLLMKVIS